MPDSNRLSISLPKGVYEKLEARASTEGRAVSSLASVLIERMMFEDERNALWVETMAHYHRRLVEQQQQSEEKITHLQGQLRIEKERSKLELTLPMVIKSALLRCLSGENLSDLELTVLCDFFGYDQNLVHQARSADGTLTQEQTNERGEKFTDT